jgi:hypothetical protein
MALKELENPWKYSAAFNDLLMDGLPSPLDSILEWGAGSSTIQFCFLARIAGAKYFLSLDEHLPYLKTVTKFLGSCRELESCAANLFAPENEGSELNQYGYTTAPLAKRRNFDVILVDGRARSECLFVAALLVSERGFVILDDTRRHRYTPALRFFTVEKTNIKTSRLRLKPELRPFFQGFLASLPPVQEQNSIAPPLPISWPNLRPFHREEEEDLEALLECHAQGVANAFSWGTPAAIQFLTNRLGGLKQNVAVISYPEEATQLRTLNGKAEVLAASVRGEVNDRSQDPLWHYASIPNQYGGPFDLAYVGGFRRNECLLNISQFLKMDSKVILREGHLNSYAPGRFLFTEVERTAHHVILTPKPGLHDLLSEMGKQAVKVQDRPFFRPAEDAPYRKLVHDYLESFLRSLQAP